MGWGRLDLEADRWTAFAETWRFSGEDWTGATLLAQVRLYNDAPGSALIDLTTVTSSSAEGLRIIYAGTDTVGNHVTAGRLPAVPDGMPESDSLALTLIGIRINETTMEAMPFSGERGGDGVFVWDLHVTPAGGLKQKVLGGRFIVQAGATQ